MKTKCIEGVERLIAEELSKRINDINIILSQITEEYIECNILSKVRTVALVRELEDIENAQKVLMAITKQIYPETGGQYGSSAR